MKTPGIGFGPTSGVQFTSKEITFYFFSHFHVYSNYQEVSKILGGGFVWKRRFVFFILLVSCLGIVFNSTSLVKADVNTSTYDVTIVSGEAGSGSTGSTSTDNEIVLPKTNLLNKVTRYLPQLSEQQTLALIFGGLILIIILLGLLIQQLKKRWHA